MDLIISLILVFFKLFEDFGRITVNIQIFLEFFKESNNQRASFKWVIIEEALN